MPPAAYFCHRVRFLAFHSYSPHPRAKEEMRAKNAPRARLDSTRPHRPPTKRCFCCSTSASRSKNLRTRLAEVALSPVWRPSSPPSPLLSFPLPVNRCFLSPHAKTAHTEFLARVSRPLEGRKSPESHYQMLALGPENTTQRKEA